jgi:hypothetical protein
MQYVSRELNRTEVLNKILQMPIQGNLKRRTDQVTPHILKKMVKSNTD